MALATEYAWALGHGVSLSNLSGAASELRQYNYRHVGTARREVGISSPPVDLFPVRTMLGSGRERGDGRVDHSWQMVLSTYAVEYALDTYLASGSVQSVAVTINTRRHELNTFARYNAYLTLPSRANGDIEYLRQNLMRVTWRFTNLIAL